MLIEEALDILAVRLRTIPGLEVLTNPATTITAPMAVVEDDGINFDLSMAAGACEMAFTVTVYVAKTDSASGLTEARGYLSAHGASSVRAALEDQRTDALGKGVNVSEGSRDRSDNYITATFSGSTYVPPAD